MATLERFAELLKLYIQKANEPRDLKLSLLAAIEAWETEEPPAEEPADGQPLES